MLSKAFIVLSFFVSFKAFSATLSLAPEQGVNVCQFEKVEKENLKLLKANCSGIVFSEEEEVMDNKFLRWGNIKGKTDSYLYFIFTKGVHGEKAKIYSLKSKKLIKELRSSWPISLERRDNLFSLSYKLDKNKTNDYAKKSYQFD